MAANYLEAQERLSRKESRESGLWLRLLDVGDGPKLEIVRGKLACEADELKRIFPAIAGKDDTGDES